MQFARLYVIIVLVNREQNDYFVRSYFKCVCTVISTFLNILNIYYFQSLMNLKPTFFLLLHIWTLPKVWNGAWEANICTSSRLGDGVWENIKDCSLSWGYYIIWSVFWELHSHPCDFHRFFHLFIQKSINLNHTPYINCRMQATGGHFQVECWGQSE